MPRNYAGMSIGTLMLSIAGHLAVAQTVTEQAPPPTEPRARVALVLSGGGARGFAHLGVLRVLHEMNVPVDLVVGTSMGSVVGGAYAAGSSLESLEEIVKSTDWDSVIADRPARDTLTFRRREDDILLPSRIEFGVFPRGILLPPSAAGNAALEMTLTRLLPPGSRDRPVNQLPLPFRSVASDLVTGELVEMVDAPLFTALRASLAVPGLFAPVRVDKRLLVDGGLVRNLPIDLARAMGAKVIIAVNVGTPLADESQLGTAVGVAQQMLNILTEQNVQRSLRELGPQDILITPDLTGLSLLDFDRHQHAIRAGAEAARRLAERLQALAVSSPRFAEWERQRLAGPANSEPPEPVARIEIQGATTIAAPVLETQSGLRIGEPASRADLDAATRRLYGRADLERVEIESTPGEDGQQVVVKVKEAEWASSRLRLGLELASDFADRNTFNIGLLHVASSLNHWGAELRTVARIGSQREVGMQWWQPLGAGSPWYVAPTVQHGRSAVDIFSFGRRLSRADVNSAGAALLVGRQLADWGDIHYGIVRESTRLRTLVPDDETRPAVRVLNTQQFVQLRVDTLDSLTFPVRGHLLVAVWDRSITGPLSETSSARSQATGLYAFGTGEWAGHLYGEWARAQAGFAPLNLGGFLRLSGTPANSVDGQRVVLGRIVVARRVGTVPIAFGGIVRAGFSVEFGGGFRDDQSINADSLRKAASGFLSIDTRFGPLFLGAGVTQGIGSTLYLFLGPIWR